MKLSHLALAASLLAPLSSAAQLSAAEVATANVAQAADETKSTADLLEKLKAAPNDVFALNDYLKARLSPIMKSANTDADGAVQQLKELQAELAKYMPTEEKAVKYFGQVDSLITSNINRIELRKLTLADLRAKIVAAPEDAALIGNYAMKLMMELTSAISADWKAAEKSLADETSYLDSLAAGTEVEAVKAAVTRAKSTLSRLNTTIQRQQRLEALVGEPAMPLKAEAWVNGAPLTDDQLKGKVVMLDFFAIWCGPCIATFPHLRELDEEYGDKGLVIVGVTDYYNYGWDEEKQAPAMLKGGAKISPVDEQAMLQKFAASHELKNVIAIDPEGTISKYYAVSPIPHIVLIDQEGKVAMVKIGSGDANAKALHDKIQELLGES